ncbi:MAG TPA: hypothetical protein VGG39_17760 [Polyangiaceae bacterium]|jgi:hypothetical protein
MGTTSGVSGGAYVAPVTGQDTTASNAANSREPSLLPEPAGIGSGAIGIAMLMTRIDQQDRNDESQTEDAANVAAERDDAQRVQDMEKKASDDVAGAWASGIAGIAAGVLTIGSGVASDHLGAGGVANGINWRTVLAGASTGVNAAGGIVSGGYKAAADGDDASAAAAQASADADVRQYEHANTQVQNDTQEQAQVQQTLAAVLQSEAATRSAATGYRG